MVYKFSKRSLNNLKGVHPDMVKLMKEAIKTTPIDFTIIEGVRTTARQLELYKAKKSRCDGIYKKSNHQVKKDGYGYAVDVVPYPVDWSNINRFILLSKHIKSVANKLGIRISYGGDWTMKDFPHWELKSV